MIGVLIVPTGIGAAIGGHAGDANPVCKLIAECCDTLITHPNVVNASDINEMPANVLYVEGSLLDRFLEGSIGLDPVRTYNRILVVANPPVSNETINAVAAARVTIGIEAEIVKLNTPLRMVATMGPEGASGEVSGIDELVEQVSGYSFDALAVHTPIEVPRDVALRYYREGGINPWGGVEAMASRAIASRLNKPVAHAPLESVGPDDPELFLIHETKVPPRIAPEAVSNCYLHCVLKGLHRAPRLGTTLNVQDVDFLLTPYGCWGLPHQACRTRGIPIIVVRENTVAAHVPRADGDGVLVENYWEAAGWIMSQRAGVRPGSVRSDSP